MNLTVPVVGSEPGPDWANDLNASLTVVDSHNHAPGSGVQINPAGININSDLTFNASNNAIALRSVRFAIQSANLSGPADLGCLYEVGVDLYYNDGAGNQIRITQGGSVAGSSGTITGLPSGTASAAFVSASGTFIFQQATSTAANLDVGTVIIRYPGSYPTPAGNYIALEAPTSLASGYALTLPALPSQTNVMTLGTGGIISSITYDAVGTGMTSVGANAIAEDVTRTVSNPAPVLGIAVSASCGSFTFTNGTNVAITNFSVQIVTSGRPIMVMIIPDGNTSGGNISQSTTGNVDVSTVKILNNGSLVFTTTLLVSTAGGVSYAIAPLAFLDIQPAGTYIYTVTATAGNTFSCTNMKLLAYEI